LRGKDQNLKKDRSQFYENKMRFNLLKITIKTLNMNEMQNIFVYLQTKLYLTLNSKKVANQ